MNSDQKTTEIEISIAHQEKTISDLNQVILDQQKAIEMLALRISQLENKVKVMPVSNIKPISEESPPPHY